MDQLVRAVLDAVGRQDWDAVRLVLHPYIHWTERGAKTRGRTNVLARLVGMSQVAPPASVEIRDNQIYRWTTATPSLLPGD